MVVWDETREIRGGQPRRHTRVNRLEILRDGEEEPVFVDEFGEERRRLSGHESNGSDLTPMQLLECRLRILVSGRDHDSREGQRADLL